MKLARIFGYVGLIWGALRLAEYCFLGDLHRGYALAWAIQALVFGVAILALTKEKSESRS
ncbi:MAG TPA: hypothetical protein VJC06_00670 [Candidatus Paceibacterota bacterium]